MGETSLSSRFFFLTILRFPRRPKKGPNTSLRLSRFGAKKLNCSVIRIRSKDFCEIWHDDRTLYVDNSDNGPYFDKTPIFLNTGHFTLNWAKKLVCFVLGICCEDFSEILSDDRVLYVNKSSNGQYFENNFLHGL